MGILGKLIKNAIELPVNIVSDTLSMGGVLNDDD